MKFLKKRITRISAFVIAFILFGICAFTVTDKFISNVEILTDGRAIINSMDYDRTSVNNLYEKLWFIGNIYLKNTDSSGRYACSEEMQKSICTALKEKGLMDSDGKIIIDDLGDCEYYVSYGNNSITNTKTTKNELLESDYTYSYCDENHIWYSTNYGLYYYMYGNSAIAIFDYDIDGLNYYVDDYGAKIYYKTDGTTPMPINYDSGEVYETDGKANFIYDAYTGEWKQSDHSEFFSNPENDNNLKIMIKPNDAIIADYEKGISDYNRSVEDFARSLISAVPVIVVVFLLSVFVFVSDGWSETENKYVINKFDKIWCEVPISLATGFFMLPFVYFSPDIAVDLKDICGETYIKIIYTITLPLIYTGIVFMLCSIFRRLKCRCFFKTTLTYKILCFIFRKMKKAVLKCRKVWREKISAKELIRNDVFTRKFLLRLLVCCIWESIIVLLSIDWDEFEFMIIFSIIILLGFVLSNFRDLKSIQKLSEQIEEISNGNYTAVEVPENSVTYNMTNKLNNISGGIQNAVDKQIKSERMKIDLVTNVSHDLKTPLTSIISYINLLSMEELPQVASDYVKILEQKSDRLKSIVSDLFDLAKATSNTDVNLENIDAVILIGQVLADMSDKIEKYGKEIRTDISSDNAPIFAEGKKLYRVLQNILDNALKYSMEGTRIYIKLYIESENAVIEVKNISAYEMKFTADEITERFTRGDESRTTEGNGLGLSIAKSFTEVCGGKFAVIIDGDVFKVAVKFPLRK